MREDEAYWRDTYKGHMVEGHRCWERKTSNIYEREGGMNMRKGRERCSRTLNELEKKGERGKGEKGNKQ